VSSRRRRVLLTGLLFASSVLLSLGAGEGILRVLDRPRRRPLHVVCDCPYLYGLNRARPEVSGQGLRDREFEVPKPEGVFRVLVLGDSVTYGVNVPADRPFPKVMERRLAPRERPVEVMNAGVLGYTPYNELQYYLAEGRRFAPDLVMVAFCRNDVVDPELHWSGTQREVPRIPDAAIPNPAYHRERVAALLGPDLPVIGRRSYLVRRAFGLFDPRRQASWRTRLTTEVDGRAWPTYLTQEDDRGIQVLTDYESPEWRWLRATYAELRRSVEADGGRMALALFPLSYELEDGYPFDPGPAFARYCRESALLCVDLREALRARRGEGVFAPYRGPGSDVWHLTMRGHEVAAEALVDALTEARLVPGLRPAAERP
jgi:lysophospholipase L1-like esterase